MTIPITDEKKVSKALLKSAYLYCFDLWGYEFVYSYSGEMIRKALNDELEYPATTPVLLLGGVVKTEGIKLPKGVCYLKKPASWRSFIVNMALTDEETGFAEIFTVLIPGPGKDDWENLKTINKIIASKPDQIISMNHVTEFNISNSVQGYTQSWQLLMTDSTPL